MEIGSEFFRSNFTYIAEIYQRYLVDHGSVDSSWHAFFDSLSENEKVLASDANGADWALATSSVIGCRNEFSSLPINEVADILALEKAGQKKKKDVSSSDDSLQFELLQFELEKLATSYRAFGHLVAELDPLELMERPIPSELDFKNYKITSSDLSKEVSIFGFKDSVSNHISHLKTIYTKKLGAEISHVKNSEERDWLYKNFEDYSDPSNIADIRKCAIESLIKAESFEHAIHVKFPGAKRFSLEGGEGTIVALENILLSASEGGVSDVILGMAHRGRLNVLTHILGKPYHALFSEFMGVSSIPEGMPGSGDVKYHLGFANSKSLLNGKALKISLMPNPSHLESVNPVVMGSVRAKQDLEGDVARKNILSVLVHGDASMAGQGVVSECFAMSNLKGYTVGGTIHLVINNQIGFTANPCETKSSSYSTDVAKMIDAPIFHVNGNDIESIIKAARIIAKYRQNFAKDVVLDIVCYRKYGHNEGDEPMFTQPSMYSRIKNLQAPSAIYGDYLLEKNLISMDFLTSKKEEIKSVLDLEYEKAKTYKPTKVDWLYEGWGGIKRLETAEDLFAFKDTAISEKMFDVVGGSITNVPSGFALNSKIKKLLEERKTALLSGDRIDWATGELLSYGSLMLEGFPVRLSGEDCERGTFSHRHSVYYDQNTNFRYEPLNNMKAQVSAKYEVCNSLLSEFAVLGFEYGYSITSPNTLAIWEAQFGDFANGAVTIYDQYVSSGEDKWLQMSGIVSLLPHGFEGQGPEHSSARLERYLQYAAENNIIVCNLTTPANLFHVLRRQVKMPFRKPLIIMSPKSLLRHKLAVSSMKDFTAGGFKAIIPDSYNNYKTAKRIVFTSGKVFYDLLEERESRKLENDVAIIRIEQYYPFDSSALKKEVNNFTNIKDLIWLQEEPKNMGAWFFIHDYLEECTNKAVLYVGRPAKPSPATGFSAVHTKEQKQILDKALSL